jgi:hypothetical protein
LRSPSPLERFAGPFGLLSTEAGAALEVPADGPLELELPDDVELGADAAPAEDAGGEEVAGARAGASEPEGAEAFVSEPEAFFSESSASATPDSGSRVASRSSALEPAEAPESVLSSLPACSGPVSSRSAGASAAPSSSGLAGTASRAAFAVMASRPVALSL